MPADYFGIEYEINPWMKLSNRMDHERAVRQWHELMRVLERDLGAVLERMTLTPGLPDPAFTANAVISHFRYPERQREEAHFEQWFREHGDDVMTTGGTLYFEGAGDLLDFPEYWVGSYRQRSDSGGYPILSEHIHRAVNRFMGRKTISAANIGRATTAIRSAGRVMKESKDVGAAEENVAALQQQLADLETIAIKPTKANLTAKLVALAWTPHWRDASGILTPAF